MDALDDSRNLAKVRVAGSNPVFRSIRAGQPGFLPGCLHFGGRSAEGGVVHLTCGNADSAPFTGRRR